MTTFYSKNKLFIHFNALVVVLIILSRIPFFLEFSGSLFTTVAFSISLLLLNILLFGWIKNRIQLNDGKWIILSIAILLIYNIIGYGNKTGLESHTLTLLCTVPVFLFGYYLGYYRYRNIIYFIISILYYIVFTISIFSFFNTGTFKYDQNIYESGVLTKNYFILYWPFVFVITNVGFFTILEKSRKKLIFLLLLICSYLILLVSIMLSYFTAPIMLIVFFFIFYAFFKERAKIKTIILTGFTLVGLFFVLIYISKSEIPALVEASSEIIGFTSFVTGENTSGLKTASHGRLELLPISINSFLESPIYGKGGYWGMKESDMVSSQHSSFFDIFAFYGMLGIPLLMIYFNFLKNYIRIHRHNIVSRAKDQMILSFLCVFLSILLLSFLNPYIFFYIPADAFYMLMGGFILGSKNVNNREVSTNKHYKLKANKRY